ncbi:MAG TPA: hypothetical protein PKE32_02125, partial [Miltoncostaeaceae bacterium]|nr:hypothetical protein [Miltoncostaeaceae bacterium]
IGASADELPSTLPRFYTPTTAKAKRNGQRLAAPNSQRVTATASETAQKATIRVTTAAQPERLLLGENNSDQIRLTGIPAGRTIQVESLMYGPFRSPDEIRCDGEPYARHTIPVTASGTVQSPAVRPDRLGYYTYRVEIAGDDNLNPVATACAIPAETFVVETQPQVSTQVSAQQTRPGAQIFDTVNVTGLNGETAQVIVQLRGPFATREAISCDGAPVWTGTVTAAGDGTYTTDPFTLTTAGYYSYSESIAAGGFVGAQQSACAEVSETTVAMGAPAIRTQISKQSTVPGDSVTDSVSVSGLGALSATVNVELWGPYPSEAAMTCSGTPFWTGTFTATGDGNYTTDSVRLNRAGYYTYRESIAASEAFDAVQTECAEAAETTITTATPTVTTVASAEVLRPGATLFDTLRVQGLGGTPATVEVELFGPFATRAALRCTGTPVWQGTVQANGNGTYRTAPVKIDRVGLYTYRERIPAQPNVRPFTGRCAEVAETALVAPTINTGRAPLGASVAGARATQSARRSAPVRVRSTELNINAAVSPAGINLAKGELTVPCPATRRAPR